MIKLLRRTLTRLCYHILRIIVRSTVKIKIEGRENIPQDTKQALIVANHSSFLDVPVLACAFFDELIDISWVVSNSNHKIWFLRWLWLIFRPIVVERGGTIDKIKHDLSGDRWVAIFPEGNEKWCPPSEARKKREKPSCGAAVIALSTGVTIIPVGIKGADKVLPVRKFRFDRRHNVVIRIGKPFSYEKTDIEMKDLDLILAARNDMMDKVYSLTGYKKRMVTYEYNKKHSNKFPRIPVYAIKPDAR